jgi:hypothetical protein
MITKILFRHFKSLLVLIVFLCSAHSISGQVKLLSAEALECREIYKSESFKSLYEQSTRNVETMSASFKPIYKQTWLNDQVLEIQTLASANCAGIHNPRMEIIGPFIYLSYDFRMDADCICVFGITWRIEGLKKGSKKIILLNGVISSNYNKKVLDSSLRKYRIDDNVNYFNLYDAIDKKGLKQGLQTFENEKGTWYKLYKDGIEQK